MADLLVVALRVVGVIAGLALAVLGTGWTLDSHRAAQAYERAPRCVAGEQRECIATVTVVVVKRSRTVIDTDTDTDPFPPQQPPPPPMPPPMPPLRVVSLPAVADRVEYKVTVRMPDGRHRTLPADKGLYDRAEPGVRARVEMWRGKPTRLVLGPEDKRYPVDATVFVWLAPWTGAMLAAWAAGYHPDEENGSFFFGLWVVGAVLVYLLKGWPPVMIVVPAVVLLGIALVLVAQALETRGAVRRW